MNEGLLSVWRSNGICVEDGLFCVMVSICETIIVLSVCERICVCDCNACVHAHQRVRGCGSGCPCGRP